ncbi:MAG: haloacid dehalogenase type II [Candidatus Dormibacteraeota bacterium]|uniref:Haloacid dehalogenase type II n=1 Tax=Candidatus Aeolococcus gillhamiae TaxID=3127015 RepID=A0A934K449_9BACT|nr:haloacid dehalogenase type II [Candidatus Dormibacteraeota bacterium]
MARPPAVVLFDVIETLFSLEAVRTRLKGAGLGDDGVDRWFPRFLRDGIALAASADFRPFREVAQASLHDALRIAGADASDGAVDNILEGFSELDVYDDVRPALEFLRDRAIRVLTLSNGSAASARLLLDRAGVAPLVESALSADDVRLWKPRPEPYLHACAAVGVPPDRVALVAVHAWDIQGAASAGLITGWCARLEREYSPLFRTPDATGETLLGVVRALAALEPAQ